MAYFGPNGVRDEGGTTIAEVLRQVWKRLAHKQWLIFYPLALAIINTLAFLAVYSAAGGDLQLEHRSSPPTSPALAVRRATTSSPASRSRPALAVAVFVGLAACVFTAMLRAPLFRAIAGPGYPLTPRSWEETAQARRSSTSSSTWCSWCCPSRSPSSTGVPRRRSVGSPS